MTPFRPKPTLALTPLEGREVPAVFATVTSNLELRVTIDNDSRTAQHVQVGVINGDVAVNGSRALLNGRPVAASAVRRITVSGSDLNNSIDLRNVSTRFFQGLDGRVSVNGGAGNDTLNGSQFGDHLSGGAGDDVVSGNDGHDSVFGNTGTDRLHGGNGDDFLDGGAGDDFLDGNAGRNRFVGGIDYDIAHWNPRADTIVGGVERMIG
jgi:Ca2+-binding RTX toxin-like protein